MANILIAYILWFFLGIFGVHHFYLQRDRQAFVWWATLGGLLGLGWIRDLWHLSQYVEEANEDKAYALSEQQQNGRSPSLKQDQAAVDTDSSGYVTENQYVITDQHGTVNRPGTDNQQAGNRANQSNNSQQRPAANQERRNPSVKPSVSGARFGGMMAMGYILGYLVMFLFPRDWFSTDGSSWVKPLIYVIPPSAVAFGVHLVANIGRVQASWKSCMLGSGVGVLWLLDDPTNIGGCCLLSAVAVYFWGCSWKPRRRRRRKTCERLSWLLVCGALYLSMWGSALYFNATVTTRDGDTIPLREALNNFFTSPAWTETKESLYLVWQHVKVNGWRNIFQQIVQTFDPQGEATAYKVLGLREDVSQEEVKTRYRQLAKQWHPDKHQDPASKAQAQEKFMHIQKAYETLSNLKSRRSQRNYRHSEF